MGWQIITLLDLRQRQAATENAISSGQQSDLLFAQSKVLFVFTAATVIFVSAGHLSSPFLCRFITISFGYEYN